MGDINEVGLHDGPGIGIDFGMSNCRVAAVVNGKVKIFNDEFGNRYIPSIVTFDDRQVYIGRRAREMAEKFPVNSILNVKWLFGRVFRDADVERLASETDENEKSNNEVETDENEMEVENETEEHMGEQVEREYFHEDISGVVESNGRSLIRVNVNGAQRHYHPEELAALFLRHLRNLASLQLNKEINWAVVSVPPGFDSMQRAALLDAGKIAGLHLDLISDPAAIALAFHMQSPSPRLLFIADWGAGSLDTAVVRTFSGSVEVLSASSWPLGGMELDKALMQHWMKDLLKHPDSTMKCADKIRLRTSCQKVRITLSMIARANLEIAGVEGGPDINMVVNRATLEELYQGVVQEAERRVREELQRANVTTDDVEEIILAGGISKTPMFRRMIENVFHGRQPFVPLSGDESVLCGAAYLAELKTDGDRSDGHRIKEVYPVSVGVEVEAGLVKQLFQRNCCLPATCTRTLVSPKDVQSPLTINLFTGESMMRKKCWPFCRMNVHGIQQPSKNEVAFRFDIDKNGIFDISSTSNVQLTIDFLHNCLSELEISKMEKFITISLANCDVDREILESSNELNRFCHTMLAALKCDEIRSIRPLQECENFERSIQDALDKFENLKDVSTATLQSQLEQLKAQSRSFVDDA